MFGRLAASSRSVQTATQADAIDATCGLGAEDAGARGLGRGAKTAPSAHGTGGATGGATDGATLGVTTAGGRASRAVGASTSTVSGAARTLEAEISFEESSSSHAISYALPPSFTA